METDPNGPKPLKVRAVEVDGREDERVPLLSEHAAAKDRHDREAIVAVLRDAPRAGDTSLVGNRGYRRYLKSAGHRFEVDEGEGSDRLAAG